MTEADIFKNPPFILGLTGSIGMGKSTTAGFFAEAGIPVWDADAAVHALYAPGGDGVEAIAQLFPDAIRDGAVDREVLKQKIAADPSALQRIEAVIHPLVFLGRGEFMKQQAASGSDIIVLDVPLLFETEGDTWVDATLVCTAPAEVQRARVLARPGMDAWRLEAMLAKQMPDAQKRARADFIVETTSLEGAKAQVEDVIARIRARRHAHV